MAAFTRLLVRFAMIAIVSPFYIVETGWYNWQDRRRRWRRWKDSRKKDSRPGP